MGITYMGKPSATGQLSLSSFRGRQMSSGLNYRTFVLGFAIW